MRAPDAYVRNSCPVNPRCACRACSLAGCKILPTPTEEDKAAAAAEAFNPDQMVEEMWAPKVLPYLEGKAGAFQEVSRSLAKADREGRRREIRQSPEAGQFALDLCRDRLEGKIVASNTQSRAATIDVDVDGDGKADLRVQIGPAMRGTALRDALDFVDFNAFKNQIDFAQFGKSFNTYVNTTVLSKLPREELDGSTVKLLGAYVPGSGADLPLMTPAEAESGRRHDARRPTTSSSSWRTSRRSISGTVAVKRANFEVQARRGQRAGRRKRRRQVDADEDHRRRREADARPHPSRRRGGVVRLVGRRGGARHRHGVPGAQPVRQSDGRREHLRHARDHQPRLRRSTTRSRSGAPANSSSGCKAGIRPDMLVEDLRIGQQQLVEIAKAVSLDARILIMDEPTSALSRPRSRCCSRSSPTSSAQGVAIVYISHRLEELIRIGDYITVLRDGHITGQEQMKNVDTQWIVRQMIGSDAKDFAKADDHEPGEEVFPRRGNLPAARDRRSGGRPCVAVAARPARFSASTD